VLRGRRLPPPAATWRRSARPEMQHAAALVIWGYAIGCHDGAERMPCRFWRTASP
jgi:hypothetical protein